MSAHCCALPEKPAVDPRWRRALWIALAVNAAMFLVELAAGEIADSRALQADALDFFGDAANYASARFRPMRSISSAMPPTMRSRLAWPDSR